MTAELKIQRSEEGHRGAFFLEHEGNRIAEMTFTRVNPAVCPYAKAQFDKDPSIRDVLST